MDGQIRASEAQDDRLIKASGLLHTSERKASSPLWALLASTLMAGAACALVWALLLGPQADLSQIPTAAAPAETTVMVATEGR